MIPVRAIDLYPVAYALGRAVCNPGVAAGLIGAGATLLALALTCR